MKTLIATKSFDLKSSYFYKNKNIFILFIIMISAVISALMLYESNDGISIYNRIADIFVEYIQFTKNISKPDIFSSLLISAFVSYIAVVLVSTSIIGRPFVYFVVFFKIIGLSAVLFTLYSEFGLNGMEYSLLVMLPGKYLMILSMLILADSSSRICKILMIDVQSKSDKIKKYIIILIITALIMLISAVIDYFTLIAFAELFDFS